MAVPEITPGVHDITRMVQAIMTMVPKIMTNALPPPSHIKTARHQPDGR
ncbi:hypothetical protein KP77_29850 [Jeotgalibacillus alimentarius]|uniref:Uncharacterized protein n=1 Tax=Jeotgalibacillus alimentarius TaxID=135826 RepID=A0A0C2VHS8_9BACL|nr:hypothetical protein KP77_29850 [Jeotgalibacillus alimentarius]